MRKSDDPRRIAARRAGGALYNYWSRNAGDRTVPQSFHVSPAISVSGTTIRTLPPLGQGRTFSVREVSGVIVGPSDGSNVLYNDRNEALARFGMSETNASVFVQYLKDYGVPFYGLNGEPLIVGGGADGSRKAHPQRFVLELRRTFPLDMWIGLGLLLALAVAIVGLPIACCLGSRLAGPAIMAVLVVSLMLIAAPWLVGAWKDQLFPPKMVVEDGRAWLCYTLRGAQELCLDEVAELRYEAAGVCYALYDQKGKVLAKFSVQDDFGREFMEFLNARDIKPRFPK